MYNETQLKRKDVAGLTKQGNIIKHIKQFFLRFLVYFNSVNVFQI